jgi:hypothetical protein
MSDRTPPAPDRPSRHSSNAMCWRSTSFWPVPLHGPAPVTLELSALIIGDRSVPAAYKGGHDSAAARPPI